MRLLNSQGERDGHQFFQPIKIRIFTNQITYKIAIQKRERSLWHSRKWNEICTCNAAPPGEGVGGQEGENELVQIDRGAVVWADGAQPAGRPETEMKPSVLRFHDVEKNTFSFFDTYF